MTRKFNLLLVFQLLAGLAYGQHLPDSIVFTSNTYVNDYNGSDTLYKTFHSVLKLEGANYRLGEKRIGKNKINRLLNEITRDSRLDNTLSHYGIDTVRIKNDPEGLLKKIQKRT